MKEQYPLKLVIFDCDGVLVDSEPLVNKLFIDSLNEEGFDIEYEWGNRLHGIPLPDCIELVEKTFNKKVSHGFVDNLTMQGIKLLAKELKPIPNVKEALQQIHNPKCVASGSDTRKIFLSLQIAGLGDFFEHIFSSELVKKGKPEPDIFLYAAERLGFLPDQCIVVEDSEPGMKAAVAAGMEVLIYKPEGCIDYPLLPHAKSFKDMRELPGLIKSLSPIGLQNNL